MRNLNKIRDKREFHFDDKELITLGACSLLLILLTFWLGILIGKESQFQETAKIEEDPLLQLSSSEDPSTTPQMEGTSKEKSGGESKVKQTTLPQPGESKRDIKLSYYTALQDTENYKEQGTKQPEPGTNPPPVGSESGESKSALIEGEGRKEESDPVASESKKSDTLPQVPSRRTDSPLSMKSTLEPEPALYSIQVVSSPSREESEALRDQLREKGYDASIISINLGSQGIWYRVRVGNLTNRMEAERLKKELQEKFAIVAKNPLIVKVSE